MAPKTVYWIDGRCYSCGSTETYRRRGLVWCRGCDTEIGTSVWTRERRAATLPPGQGDVRRE